MPKYKSKGKESRAKNKAKTPKRKEKNKKKRRRAERRSFLIFCTVLFILCSVLGTGMAYYFKIGPFQQKARKITKKPQAIEIVNEQKQEEQQIDHVNGIEFNEPPSVNIRSNEPFSNFFYPSVWDIPKSFRFEDVEDDNGPLEYLKLPIFEAIRQNNLGRIRELCENDHDDRLSRLKYNPLVFAVTELKYEILEYLINTKKFYINLSHHHKSDMNTPILLAIQHPKPAIALRLVKIMYKVDTESQDNNYFQKSRTHLTIFAAVSTGNLEMIKYLLSGESCENIFRIEEYDKKNTLFHHAMQQCNASVIKLLLEKLKIAAKKRYVKYDKKKTRPFESLYGCDQHDGILDKRNADNLTPIALAQKIGCTAGVELIQNYTGETYL
jgi:hypothetical protein